MGTSSMWVMWCCKTPEDASMDVRHPTHEITRAAAALLLRRVARR